MLTCFREMLSHSGVCQGKVREIEKYASLVDSVLGSVLVVVTKSDGRQVVATHKWMLGKSTNSLQESTSKSNFTLGESSESALAHAVLCCISNVTCKATAFGTLWCSPLAYQASLLHARNA